MSLKLWMGCWKLVLARHVKFGGNVISEKSPVEGCQRPSGGLDHEAGRGRGQTALDFSTYHSLELVSQVLCRVGLYLAFCDNRVRPLFWDSCLLRVASNAVLETVNPFPPEYWVRYHIHHHHCLCLFLSRMCLLVRRFGCALFTIFDCLYSL